MKKITKIAIVITTGTLLFALSFFDNREAGFGGSFSGAGSDEKYFTVDEWHQLIRILDLELSNEEIKNVNSNKDFVGKMIEVAKKKNNVKKPVVIGEKEYSKEEYDELKENLFNKFNN